MPPHLVLHLLAVAVVAAALVQDLLKVHLQIVNKGLIAVPVIAEVSVIVEVSVHSNSVIKNFVFVFCF